MAAASATPDVPSTVIDPAPAAQKLKERLFAATLLLSTLVGLLFLAVLIVDVL